MNPFAEEPAAAETAEKKPSSWKTMSFALFVFCVVLSTGQTEASICVLLTALFFLLSGPILSSLATRKSFTSTKEWLSGLAMIPRFLSAWWSGLWQLRTLRSMAPVDITAELQ